MPDTDDRDDLLTEALARFKASEAVYTDQTQREIDNLRFQVAEEQWTQAARKSREGADEKGVTIAQRPMISIPMLDQPIQLVLNQEKAAKLGVEVHPLSPDADDDTADVLQGLYRRIEVDSRANLARSWAFDRAVKVGRGWYRINTEYADDEGGHPSDQRIVIQRIYDQSAVYPDPYAQQPDWSDGDWLFNVNDLPQSRFTRRFPDADMSQAGFDGWGDLAKQYPQWVTGTGSERVIRVAEYFRKVYEKRTIPAEGDWAGREQSVAYIEWTILSAHEILVQPQRWNGKLIPFVPVVGRELQPFDEKKRWEGVIGPNKDAVRMHNYAASGLVEQAALESKISPIVDPEAIQGYESWWNQRNVRNFPYLPYRSGTQGRPFNPPNYLQADLQRMQANMMLIQQADSFLHSGTGAFEPTLGQDSKAKSGRQVLALQQQHDQGTGNYLDSLAELSLTLEAKIVLDLMPAIYDRPGRVVRILGLEDKTETVMLNQPFTMDPRTKQPVPAAPGAMVPYQPNPQQPGAVLGLGAPHGPQEPPETLHYDLAKGRYAVTVSVNKAYDSKLQQGAQEIGEILSADPQLLPIIGPVYFKYRDGPGMKEIADLLKKMRDQQFPFLADEQDQPNIAATAAQLHGENQMLKQTLQQASKAIETKQIEQQGKLQITHVQESAETQRQQAKNETSIAVAELSAKVDRLALFLEERARLGVQTHESAMSAADAGHDERMAQMGHQQQMAAAALGHVQNMESGAVDHAQGMEAGDAQHSQALEQQSQAAALAPQPDAGGEA